MDRMNAAPTVVQPTTVGVGTSLLVRGAQVVVACTAAGIVAGGIGSRVVMRIAAVTALEAEGMVTDNGNLVGRITAEGTIALGLLVAVATAIVGASALVLMRSYLPRSTGLRGAAFGLALLLFAHFVVIDPGNADFAILGDRAQNIALFAALFIIYGIVASGALAVVESRTPARWIDPPPPVLAVLCVLPCAAIALGVAVVAVSPEGLRGPALVVAGAAAAVAWWLRERRPGAARGLRAIGWVAFAGSLAAGAADLVHSLDVFFPAF